MNSPSVVRLESLITKAIDQLNDLHDYAGTRTNAKQDTKQILNQIDTTTGRHIVFLEDWRNRTTERAPEKDPDVLSDVENSFNGLGDSIQSTKDALKHRLRLRVKYGHIPFKKTK